MAIGAVAAGAIRIGAMFARGTGSLLGRSGGMLRKATLRRSKIRRENFVRNKKLNKGLIETRKRREKEVLLETSRLGRSPSSGIVKLPGSSFFGKVLKFIGILIVGWLINNLPKIIEFVQKLIKRIQKLVDSLKNFVKNLGDWFKSIGSIVSAGWSNIKNLDFTDSEGKLKTAMDDLDKAFKGMQTDVEGMKNALTADMSEEDSGGVTGGYDGELSGDAVNQTKQLLRSSEGFRETAYWDVNAYRIGYGSDTITDASGNVTSVTQSSTVTREQAELDLERRIRTGFMPTVANQLGDNFTKLPAGAQAALTSVAYNYGSLPRSVVNASNSSGGNLKAIGDAVESLQNQDRGINRRRRIEEASIIRNSGKGGSGDGSKKSSGNRTGGYQMAVSVGKMLNKQGYDVWQHPDFNVDTGYTGSGNERVMRRSYNSYHNYGEALDVPIMQRDANGNVVSSPEKLDKLYAYLNQNRSKFNIAELKWKDDANHFDHLHVSFKGGGGSPINGMNMNNIASMPDIGYSTGPKNTIIIMEEEAPPPPMMMQQSQSSSPIIMTGASLNSIMKRKLLNDLTYT